MSVTENSILMEIPPRLVSLGGPQVHRMIPYSKKRMVGPFIFFDYFPSVEFAAHDGMTVRPHPPHWPFHPELSFGRVSPSS